MNKEVLLTVLGVIGTLGGTLLGWLLNAYTYKIGRTEIHGTFETRITMPPARPDDCDVTRSVSKMTEIEGRGGKRWDKPKKAGKSRDCRGGKF